MKGKTFKVVHNCICTTNNILIEGGEYFYKEGSYKTKAILEKVVENGEWLKLQVFFPDSDRRIEVTHRDVDYVYSGMWRLFDWNEDRIEEIEESNRMREESLKNFKPKPRFTKAAYLESLTEDMLTNIWIHLNRIYECAILNESDFNLVWLSWIVGEGYLNVSDEFVFFEMSEVEFRDEEYEFVNETELTASGKIGRIIEYYELDKLYMEVLRKLEK